ncbi:MAG: nucleoside phosphorylase [Candidatus Methanomethylicus sp.]|nr:nucleoside phosphorylase [Candidatus Methanomethylicus sp.]
MYHLKCDREDVSPKIVVCGDPGRTSKIADMLDNLKLVSGNRGLLTYTGKYRGERVTLSTTGMGTPSAAIVMEELVMLGAKAVIRLGTTGSISNLVSLGDVIVPNEAIPLDGTSRAYMKIGGTPFPDMEFSNSIAENARNLGLRCHRGKVCTSDTFYLEEQRDSQYWALKGALSFEMECAIIFILGKLRGFVSGAILTTTGMIGVHDRVLDNSTTYRSVEKSAVAALKTLVEYNLPNMP